MTRSRIKLLFLCTGNSCRSQMAEAWTRRIHPDRLEPYSAGVEPKRIDPRAVRVMKEAGIDMSSQESKSVDSLSGIPFDYVITVCDGAREACPLFPGDTRVVHAGFEDPPLLAAGAATEEEALHHYRRIRDEIRRFVEHLPEFLESHSHEKAGGN